eukprot:5082694-Prymnesium_polylepis.2
MAGRGCLRPRSPLAAQVDNLEVDEAGGLQVGHVARRARDGGCVHDVAQRRTIGVREGRLRARRDAWQRCKRNGASRPLGECAQARWTPVGTRASLGGG